jgi:transcriptional regulator with XRE-family HTH domain
MTKTREAGSSGLALFAAELVAARKRASLSQDELASRITYSGSMVAMIEGLRRVPSLDFAERCDQVFETTGTFGRLQQLARTTPLPTWFRPYAEIEATATQLRSWQPSFIDGLLQTEDYARALLSRRPNTGEDDIEALVAARMERQAILDREVPPLLWIVLDEAVLHRRVASEKVMRDQFDHLAEMSRRPNITVEVVPFSAGGHYALLGAFTIVEQGDTPYRLPRDGRRGLHCGEPATVARLALAFDTVRGETLPWATSRDFIRKRADTPWT